MEDRPPVVPNAKDAKTENARDVKDRRTEARQKTDAGSMANKSARTKETLQAAIDQISKQDEGYLPSYLHWLEYESKSKYYIVLFLFWDFMLFCCLFFVSEQVIKYCIM